MGGRLGVDIEITANSAPTDIGPMGYESKVSSLNGSKVEKQ